MQIYSCADYDAHDMMILCYKEIIISMAKSRKVPDLIKKTSFRERIASCFYSNPIEYRHHHHIH
jgi:hypothetical protein